MAGMAANISSFNTVFTYDIWQTYLVKGRRDGYYLTVGRIVTVENHSVIGGLGSAVAEVLCAQAPCWLTRLGAPDRFGESGDDETLFSRFGCNTADIVAAAKHLITQN